MDTNSIQDHEKASPQLESGWIKLFRSLLNKGYYTNSTYIHLWVHLLLKASYKETEFFFNGKPLKLKPGQFLTGRKILAIETGIPESTCERILKVFESEQQIEQQKNNKFRIISITNWQDYQIDGQQNEQRTDNKWTASGQPVDTYKNIKNIKKDIASSKDASHPSQKKDTDPRIKTIIDFFVQAVQEAKDFKPMIAAKDAAQVKRGLKNLSPERMQNQIDFFLSNGKSREHISLSAALSADTYNLYMSAWQCKKWQYDDDPEPPTDKRWW